MSDPDDNNCRDYGVFINEYNLVFAVPEHFLESLGRIDTEQLWRISSMPVQTHVLSRGATAGE